MILIAILFILGLILLVKGADFLVDGASDFAKDYGVSKWIIGVTIVAFGTSLPEFTVSLIAALKNLGDITMGNIIGSNIANVGLVIGVAALLYPISVIGEKGTSIKKEMIFLLLSSLLILFFFLKPANPYGFMIGRIKGVVLLAVFAMFFYYIFKTANRERKNHKKNNKHKKIDPKRTIKQAVKVVIGIAATIFGAKFVIDNGVIIAKTIGLSEAVIALSLIAIGTSLPELATSIVAALKKKADVAIGNIVGSIIFNSLWVVGFTAVIRPFTLNTALFFDALVMLVFSLALMFVAMTGRGVSRFQGALLFLGYVLYIIYLF